MFIVGLTGGIGSGKSTIASFFRELGVPVYDSDAEAKALMVSSEELREGIIQAFGKESYEGQSLNKNWLSEQVFGNDEALEKLNSLVHPAVRKHFLQWAEAQDYPFVIQETALIFENQAQDKYDFTLLVYAPEETRIQRVMSRSGWSREKIAARISAQLSDEQKKELADQLLENIDLEVSRARVKQLHKYYLQQATATR